MAKSGLEADFIRHFSALSSRNKIIAEYIWVGGSGSDLRSKTRVLSSKPKSVAELPIAHFDGSFTQQANEQCSTVYLQPRIMVPDPFRGGDHILVLCDTFSPPSLELGSTDMRPHQSNNRYPCEMVMRQAAGSEPAFSVEQQYTLLDPASNWPIGWPERGFTEKAPSTYCGVGVGSSSGREFAESHVLACLHANIPITGASSEVVPGQWSYKVGPCCGVDIGDQLWLSRYILSRCSETYSLKASLDPKPVPGDWCSSGAFVKFSTKETRHESKGWDEIQRHVGQLEKNHLQHLMVYGSCNALRLLTGPKPLGSPLHFTWGLEERSASVRIPHCSYLHRKGWYQDRRPASDMDPYLVSMMLVRTTLGIPLPLSGGEQAIEMSDESSGISRSSSGILSELDHLQDSFAPDTPPQNMSLLSSECTSRRR